MSRPPRRTVSLVSLGCSKNLVDSEALVSTLLSRGFQVLAEPEGADLVIVNTCGFLEASRQESIEVTRRALAWKSQGTKGVLVAGCMVGNYRAELAAAVPEVDRFVSFSEYGRIDRIADELLPPPEAASFLTERNRIDASLTPAHYSYLKISEGCNHTCAFCVIPDIRGRMASRPVGDLVRRAENLAERGVRELVLIAQDSTSYGADLYGSVRLAELLERLDRVAGLAWIRLMYAYPTEVRGAWLRWLAEGERVLPYLDVPIQHASTSVLERMRRGYGRPELEAMVRSLRASRPDITLRTTVIVGFPGETESDFQQLLEFLEATRFAHVGAFRYSREPGSRAADLPDGVPAEVIDERYHRIMALQQEIAFARNRDRVGKREQILVDSAADAETEARGRSRGDAPEVDGRVHIVAGHPRAGDLVEVEVVEARGYDVAARMIGAESNGPLEV